MAEITNLARLVDGLPRNIKLKNTTLGCNSVKLYDNDADTSGVELTKSILSTLIGDSDAGSLHTHAGEIAAAIAVEATARDAAILVETTNREAAILGEVTARDAAIAVEATARDAAILVETTNREAAILGEVTARDAAIAVEATARDAAILVETTNREAAILGEVTARDAAISAAIAVEATARDAAILVETTNREAAILGEVTARDAAIAVEATARDAAILVETTNREAAILGEVTARDAAIAVEATARDAAIAVEATARDAAILVETTNREAAILVEVTARDAAIAVEATARDAAIAVEATARDAAILVETTNREAAILVEVTARDAAIASAILNNVTNKLGAIDGTELSPGIATLISGKIPVSQLPSAVMEYKGAWNASTNTPTLSGLTPDSGDVYRVSVGVASFDLGDGVGSQPFYPGDFIVYSAVLSKFQRSPMADGVISVNGQTGAITIDTSNTDVLFTNNTSATLSAGTVVSLSQTVAGEIIYSKSNNMDRCEGVVGVVVTDILDTETGYVRIAGEATVLVDELAGLTLGKRAYVASMANGCATITPPTATGSVVYLLGIASDTHKVILNKQLVAVND